MDRISGGETDCIKAALGEMVYNIFVTRPVLSEDGEDAGRDPSLVTRLFSCLTQDNVVLAMIVLRDATAGRMDEEVRRCRVPLALRIPESYHEQAGLEWEGERVPAKELAEINAQILGCLPEEEVAALQFRLYQQLVEMVPIDWQDVRGVHGRRASFQHWTRQARTTKHEAGRCTPWRHVRRVRGIFLRASTRTRLTRWTCSRPV